MCNDFLPDSINAFLDDVETTTCLPILVIIIICTIQFILNHIFDIAYIIFQTIQDRSNNNGNGNEINLISKLKAYPELILTYLCPLKILNNLFHKSPISSPKSSTGCKRINKTGIPQEEEW